MKVYWDTSALLNALASPAVLARLDKEDNLTRSHGYAETFHHLSGLGLPLKDGTRQKVTPADAAKMVRSLAKKLRTQDLTEEQTMTALDDAQSKGVMGKGVHDWLHVRAAKLAGAEVVLSRDGGLSGLCPGEGLEAEWP
jgi:predicted nucleic acid-binding protein